MAYSKKFAKRPRRASSRVCVTCGATEHLIDCGVPDHKFWKGLGKRPERECNGRVYAHESTGGMECPEVRVN